jgi:hypothetical protein
MITRQYPSAFGQILFLLAAFLLFPTHAHGGGRRRVMAVSPASPPLQLTLVGTSVIDAGTIVWRGGSDRSTKAVRSVTLRIGEPSREARGTATIRAFVETFDRRCKLRIDGIELTTVPRVIRRHAPVGVPFTHRIEIEVPVTAADGPLDASIAWEVTTES